MNADLSHRGGSLEQRAQALAALGDPTRLAVMELLAGSDQSPDALAATLGIPGNLLAHHLKVLQTAGLIRRVHSKNDRRRTYVQAVEGALAGLLPAAESAEVPRVVFVCTHNSARSVLAEALWQEASDVPSASAGTHPAEQVNPGALRAARRHGLTITSGGPRLIDDVLNGTDLVISVCDSVNEELGPLENAHLHWSIPDPAAEGTDEAFDAAVQELSERITRLAPRVRYRRKSRSSFPTRRTPR